MMSSALRLLPPCLPRSIALSGRYTASSFSPPQYKRGNHRWIILSSGSLTESSSGAPGPRERESRKHIALIRYEHPRRSAQLNAPPPINASTMNGTSAATGSASCRFAHYFVVCGLDTETGLEQDDGAGRWLINQRFALWSMSWTVFTISYPLRARLRHPL